MKTHQARHGQSCAALSAHAMHGVPNASPATSRQVRQILRAPRPQTKLTVGAPDDAFEREADQVADQVMRMPEPGVQRMCAECEEEPRVRRAVAINAPIPGASRATRQEEEEVRCKALPSETGGGLESEAGRAVASKDFGRPLSEASRRFFEPRFGADFSAVRLHEGPSAERSARGLNARAFAYGSDVWLGAGERESNRSLLAHELVHVVQQGRAPVALRRYVRTNTAFLWDVYDAAGRDPAAVTDIDLRTTIEYEDYMRADLTWRFSDMVAIAALRRSMELFGSGVRGQGPNYVRAGSEARAAAHGITSIFVTELGFTGDHQITSVTGSLGGTKGALIDDPDGSSPVWTIGGARKPVAYTLGTPPAMFGKFSVVGSPAAPVPNVQVRARVDGTLVGEAAGLQISGGAIESAPGSGQVTGIAGGAAVPGADVGDHTADFRFETSTDGGRVWFPSGTARVDMVFTAAAPAPPGGILRQDVLEWGGLMISSSATAAEELRRLVKVLVTYNPRIGMPPSFTTSDDVMTAFTVPHQCDSMAYLLRYLALSFGIPADVVYFWYGTPTELWHYSTSTWTHGPAFQCDRPAEDMAVLHPHFNFHALASIGGTLHDAAYDFAGLPGILEHAPGAAPQTGPRADYFAATDVNVPWTCPH